MKLPRLSLLLLLSLLACQAPAVPSLPDDSDPFAGAQWIAMEPDSTILFPHVHLLAEDSPQGRSLKEYTLPELSRDFRLPDGRVFTVPAGNYAYAAGTAS